MPNLARFIVMGGAVAAFAMISTAHAGSVSWSNASGGLWQDGMNWSGAAEPGSSDDVLFDLGSMYTVLFNATAAVNSLTVGEDDVVFNLDGHTLSLLSAGSPLLATQANHEGITSVAFRNGELSLPNAAAVLNEITDGSVYESIFRLTLDNTTWAFGGDLITGQSTYVGPLLDLNVINGAQVSLQDLLVDGPGSVRAAGEGSTLDFGELRPRGFNPNASAVVVEDGAIMTATSIEAKSIHASGPNSQLVTSGAIRASDDFEFSTPGGPTIVVTDGATVSSGSLIAVGFEGLDVFFSPYVQISGKDTRVETGLFSLGANGQGVLSDGARLESAMGHIHDWGSFTVESGAVWENQGAISLFGLNPSLSVLSGGRVVADAIYGGDSFVAASHISGDGTIEANVFAGSDPLVITPRATTFFPLTDGRGDVGSILTIIGDLTLNGSSEINLRILDALVSSSVSVEGVVSADGAIQVVFDSEYTPAAGHSFVLLSAELIEGSFSYALPGLPDMLEWSIMASDTEISATIIPTPGAGAALGLCLALGAAGRRRNAKV